MASCVLSLHRISTFTRPEEQCKTQYHRNPTNPREACLPKLLPLALIARQYFRCVIKHLRINNQPLI